MNLCKYTPTSIMLRISFLENHPFLKTQIRKKFEAVTDVFFETSVVILAFRRTNVLFNAKDQFLQVL